MLTEFDVLFTEENPLEGLIDTEAEFYTNKAMIDTDKIESFYPCVKKHNGRNTLNILLDSGDVYTVLMSYEQLKKLLS